MKKFLSAILVFSLCLSFAGCVVVDEPQKESADSQSEVQSGTEKGEQTFSLNETATFKNLKFTATDFKESDGVDFFTPKEGNVFVGVKFTIENISNEDQNVSTLLLFNGYVDDIKCEYSFNASCAFDEGTLDGTIAPGKKLVGWYALEVPENWSTLELEVESNLLSNNSAKFVFTK